MCCAQYCHSWEFWEFLFFHLFSKCTCHPSHCVRHHKNKNIKMFKTLKLIKLNSLGIKYRQGGAWSIRIPSPLAELGFDSKGVQWISPQGTQSCGRWSIFLEPSRHDSLANGICGMPLPPEWVGWANPIEVAVVSHTYRSCHGWEILLHCTIIVYTPVHLRLLIMGREYWSIPAS